MDHSLDLRRNADPGFPTCVLPPFSPCLRAKADDAAAAELQGEPATEEAKEEKANAPEYDGKAAQDKDEPAPEAGDESRDEDDIDRTLTLHHPNRLRANR